MSQNLGVKPKTIKLLAYSVGEIFVILDQAKIFLPGDQKHDP